MVNGRARAGFQYACAVSRGRRWRWPAWVATLLLGLVAVSFLPPVRLRLTGALIVLRGVGVGVPSLSGRVASGPVDLEPGVTGNLYLPASRGPAIVLVPGAAPRGANDPRVKRLAHALALADRVVFVPQLDLRHRVFTEADIERLVRSVLALRRSGWVDGTVGFLGISYGGSFALIAASDRRIAEDLGFVATFGAYLDIRHVIQGITAHATTPNGQVEPWEPAPQADEILLNQARRLLPDEAAALLDQALAGQVSPEALPSDARAMYAVLTNRDPHRALELVDALPVRIVARLEAFSPAGSLDRIRAPVAVMHSTLDPAVPPSEARLLAERLDAPLFVLSSFRHVDLGSVLTGLPDLWRATGFATWMLKWG